MPPLNLPKDLRGWQVVPSPKIPEPDDQLSHIVMTGPADGWAVGTYDDPADERERLLVERWNGQAWKRMALPAEVSDQARSPDSISASAPDNVWIWARGVNGSGKQWMVHWDGERWTLPDLGLDPRDQTGHLPYAAAGDDDLWVVRGNGTQVVHVDGADQTVVPLPKGIKRLQSAAAAGPDDVWFVGTPTGGPGPVLLRWHGGRMAVVPVPGVAGVKYDGFDVLMQRFAGPSDGWLTGAAFETVEGDEYSRSYFSWHWDGRAWRERKLPAAPEPKRGSKLLAPAAGGGMWASRYAYSRSGSPLPMWHYVPGKGWLASAITFAKDRGIYVSEGAIVPGTDLVFVVGNWETVTKPTDRSTAILVGR